MTWRIETLARDGAVPCAALVRQRTSAGAGGDLIWGRAEKAPALLLFGDGDDLRVFDISGQELSLKDLARQFPPAVVSLINSVSQKS